MNSTKKDLKRTMEQDLGALRGYNLQGGLTKTIKTRGVRFITYCSL